MPYYLVYITNYEQLGLTYIVAFLRPTRNAPTYCYC